MEKLLVKDFTINFFSGKKEYRSLSNFWENDITIEHDDKDNKRIYESGEHCFHGEKYIILGELCNDEDRKRKLVSYGNTFIKPSQYKTCAIAKKMGGKKGFLLNKEELEKWASACIDVQHRICKWKLENYEEVRNDLCKSSDKILIHPAMRCSDENLKNRLWEGRAIIEDGKIVVLGKNLLGNIWMEYRDLINKTICP
jgi:predicted NAD-dependent protein-ADP-ribosyltransferase YbiA (DUF1768 family)